MEEREAIFVVRVTFARQVRVLSVLLDEAYGSSIPERSSKVKLGTVCGVGWLAEPHEKGKRAKGGSIARTTWQQPSRLNEANSLSLSLSSPSLSFPPSLPSSPSFRPFYPVILSLAASVPASRFKSNSRRVELAGRGPAPTKIDFGKTKRARERWPREGERCDTDYGPAGLPSDLLCIGRAPSCPTREVARGKQDFSFLHQLPRSCLRRRSKARLVPCAMHSDRLARKDARQDRPKLGSPMRHSARACEGGTAEGCVGAIIKGPPGRVWPQKGKFADESSKSRELVNGTSNGDIREDFGKPRERASSHTKRATREHCVSLIISQKITRYVCAV